MGRLEVRESVVAQEINSIDSALILAQRPCIPRIDMSDLLALESGAFKSTADLFDVANDLGGCCTNASIIGLPLRAAAVQIFRSDTNANNSLLHLWAPVFGGLFDGGDFVVDCVLSCGRPET